VYLERADGKSLIYPGKTHSFVGKSESLKTWAALYVCAEAIANEEHVLYIDFEDTLVTFLQRLTLLGVPRDMVAEHAHFIRPDEPVTDAAKDALRALLTRHAVTVCVIDGVTEAIAVQGLDPDRGKDIAKWANVLPKFVASFGPASILIDHTPHDRDREIGSVHKRNMVDGAVYVFKTRGDKFGVNTPGRSSISVEKDRPGTVRAFARGKQVGTLCAEATPTGVSLRIAPPGTDDMHDGEPDHDLMDRVIAYVTANPGCSTRKVLKNVTGGEKAIHDALAWLDGKSLRKRDGGWHPVA
jgi:hypothetical protein